MASEEGKNDKPAARSAGGSSFGGWGGNIGSALGSFTQRTAALSTILNTSSLTSSQQGDEPGAEAKQQQETETDNDATNSANTQQQNTPQKIPSDESKSSSMTPLSSRSPEDVSKEELLEILAKMNKRVKALNGARVQLQEKCAKVEHDNFRLMSLLKEEVLTEADMIDATNQLQIQNTKATSDPEQLDEINLIQRAWRVADERNSLVLQQLQNEFKVIAMKTEAEVEKVKKAEIERSEQEFTRLHQELEAARSSRPVENVEHGDISSEVQKTKEEEGQKVALQMEALIREKDACIETLKREIAAAKEISTKENDTSATADISKIREQVAAEYETKINEMKQAIKGKLLAKIKEVKDEATRSNQAEVERVRSEMEARIAEEVERTKFQLETVHKEEIELRCKEMASVNNESEAQQMKNKTALEELRNELSAIHASELQRAIEQVRLQLENETKLIKGDMEAQFALLQDEKERAIFERDIQLKQLQERLSVEIEAKDQANAELQRSTEALIANNAQVEKELAEVKESLANEQQRTGQEIKKLVAAHKAEKAEEIARARLSIAEEFDTKIAELQKQHECVLEEQISRLRIELGGISESELQLLREEVASEYESKMVDQQKTLMEERESELQQIRVEIAASHAEELKQVAAEAAKVHARELEQIRKEALVDSDRKILALQEQHKSMIHSEMERLKAELSSSSSESELELQRLCQAVTCEYELKMEDLRKTLVEEHEMELQRVRAEILASHAEDLRQAATEAADRQSELLERVKNEISVDAESRIAAFREQHQSMMQLKDEKISTYESQLQLLREALASEHEVKMEDLRKALVEERKTELQQFSASHAENLKQVVAEAAEFHTIELEQIRKEGLEEADRRIAILQEHHESLMRAEIERVKAELSSSSESELQIVRQKVVTEFEAKFEDIQKLHLEELQQARQQMLSAHADERERMVEEAKLHFEKETQKIKSELEARCVKMQDEKERAISEIELKMKNTVERLSVEIEAKDQANSELQRSTEALIANNAQVEKELAEVKESLANEQQRTGQEIKKLVAAHEAEKAEEIARARLSIAEEFDTKIAELQKEHECVLEEQISRLRIELGGISESELQLLREEVASEYESKMVDQQKTLMEERESELQQIRVEIAASHAEELKQVAAEAAKVHARELEQIRKEALVDSDRKILALQEQHKSMMHSEMERLKAELSSSSESGLQIVRQQVIAEYEAKIEDIKKLHSEDLEKTRQQILSSYAKEREQFMVETADSHRMEMSRFHLESSEGTKRKIEEVVERLELEWKAKLDDALHREQAKSESEHKVYKEKVSKFVKDLKSKIEIKNSSLLDMQRVLQSHEKDLDSLRGTKQKLEEELELQRRSYEKAAEDIRSECASRLDAAEENRSLLIQELAQARDSQSILENKVVELQRVISDKQDESDRIVKSLTERLASEMEALKILHAEELACAQQGGNEQQEDTELLIATIKAENDEELKKIHEKMKVLVDSHASSLVSLESQLKERAVEAEEMLSRFNEEKALLKADLEADYSERIENLKAERNQKMSEIELQNKKLDEQVSTISRLEDEKRAIIEKAKVAFTKQLKTLKEQHASKIAELEDAFEVQKNSTACEIKDLIEKHKAEIESLNNRQKLAHSENEKKLNGEIALLTEKIRDQIVSREKVEAKVKSLTQELKEASEASLAVAASQQESHNQVIREKNLLEKEISDLKTKLASSENHAEELLGKLDTLSSNLSSMADTQKKYEEMLDEATTKEEMLVKLEKELSALREEGNKLKLEQVQSSGLVSRLQAEKDATERKYGQRTALIGMLEAQISELKASSEENKMKVKEMLDILRKKDDELRAMSKDLQRVQAEATSNQHFAESSAVREMTTERDSKLIQSLQSELQSVQQQMARKSAAAQNLLRQREAECAKLNEALKKLQKDLDKGGVSDRRIFEIAEKQSNRDSAMIVEIEIRDKLMDKMKDALVDRDGDLATAEYQCKQQEDQVAELSRVHRREDVNLDYLKSTVVQYLSKPPGSSERTALLPVLATLLQFNEKDYALIEEGKKKLSWWGSILPVDISANAPKPTPMHRDSEDADLDIQETPLLPQSTPLAKQTSSNNSTIRQTQGSAIRKPTSLQF